MKLIIKKKILNDREREIYFEVLEKNYCCEQMQEHYEYIFVISTECENHVNELSFALHKHSGDYCYGDYFDHDYYYKIGYCPFCGAKVEFDITEKNITDEYKKLKCNEKDLEEKIKQTDSKSEESILRKSLYDVRGGLNKILENRI